MNSGKHRILPFITFVKEHVHDWDEPTYTWAEDNSTVTATRICKKESSHVETETVSATSKVTKEATETEDGERTYTSAAFENSAFTVQTKTEIIPKLDPGDDPQPDPKPQPQPDGPISYRNTEGDGLQWTKGSRDTADFTFQRSEDDSETFAHFTGIHVDGRDVDDSSYTAESGSVVVKLKPVFLETLSVGRHTITAFFNDGNSASAKFTIVEKKNSTNPAVAETGDNSNIVLWIALLCAAMLILRGVFKARRRIDALMSLDK